MNNNIEIKTKDCGETAFDRAKLIPWWSQDVLSRAKVLVLGAGATGNETLKDLALLGVGNIFLADMDKIAKSNLSRTVLFTEQDVGKYKAEVAAGRIKQMNNNPDHKVDYFVGDVVHKLGHGVFRRFDVILGCLDNALTRVNANHRCCLFRKPYIDVGIYELGLTLQVYKYPESGCLACNMDSQELAQERMLRYSCDVFKKRAIQENHAPTVTIPAAIGSAMQVQEAVKALHELNGLELMAPVRYGRKYYFQGTTNTFLAYDLPVKEDCDQHYSIDEVIETPLSAKNTLGEALAYLEELLGYECVIDTYPDSSFVTTARCVVCGKELDMYRPQWDIYQDELYCEDCVRGEYDGYTSGYDSIDLFDKDCGLTDYTLEQLGIPPLHVIAVRAKDDDSNVKYVELTADLESVLPNIFGGN